MARTSLEHTITLLKSKDQSSASDFILCHRILEGLWSVHHNSNFLSADGEQVFFPVTILSFRGYIDIFLGKSKDLKVLEKVLGKNKDFKYLQAKYGRGLFEMIYSFTEYTYQKYLYYIEELETYGGFEGIIEYNQKSYLTQFELTSNDKGYGNYSGLLVPTVKNINRLLRRLYDTGGIKILENYFDVLHTTTSNDKIVDFVENNFTFNKARGAGISVDSSYTSFLLYSDTSLILSTPYYGCRKINLRKGGKLYILIKDLLIAYPKSIPTSPKYSKVFEDSRTNKTPESERLNRWKGRVEKKILGEFYIPENGFLEIHRNTIQLKEIPIPI